MWCGHRQKKTHSKGIYVTLNQDLRLRSFYFRALDADNRKQAVSVQTQSARVRRACVVVCVGVQPLAGFTRLDGNRIKHLVVTSDAVASSLNMQWEVNKKKRDKEKQEIAGKEETYRSQRLEQHVILYDIIRLSTLSSARLSPSPS